jgi:hypothetical protein
MAANLPVIAVVIEGIAVTRAKAIAAAIRPYSIAVAPDSSLRNLFMKLSNNDLTAPTPLVLASCLVASGYVNKLHVTS